MKTVSPAFHLRITALSLALTGASLFSGCALGPVAGTVPATDTRLSAFGGALHGGPNPVIGATVIMYATTSNGYGATATMLQEANQTGTTAHQDTDANGSFTFPGGVACPAGQYAYVVAYGGNTGANAVNPNSILMTALGACNNLYTGTTYNGNNIFINELTTVAAGYALGNFMTIAGTSAAGFSVNIGAPTTNNASTGSVTAGTPAVYASPGLRDAFSNALNLVPYSGGLANSTTTNGAVVPTVLINTLGNVLQSCVNSTGGSAASPTAPDSTPCGKLFAYTAFTNTATTGPNAGTTTTTLPTNTLAAIVSLARRPSANATEWNANCTAAAATGLSGVTCIYNLATPMTFYQPTLSGPPPDYVMGISYPKNSLGVPAVATCNTSGTAVNFTTDALYYPWNVAIDADDNVVVLNEDSSNGTCYSILTVKNDGTSIGGSQWVLAPGATSTTNARWLSTDQFGHAIVPSGLLNVVNIFAAGSSDTNIALTVSVANTSTSTFSAVDNAGNIYVGGQGTTSNLQLLTATSATHTAPTYTAANVGTAAVTAKISQMTLDINGNLFANSSSSTASSVYAFSPGATSFITKSGIAGNTSPGVNVVPDIYGNNWTTVENVALTGELFYQTVYSGTGATFALTTPAVPAGGTVTPPIGKLAPGDAIDGNNVIWYSDMNVGNSGTSGSVPVTPGYIRGYDTVNAYSFPQLFGCRVQTGQSLCGSQTATNSSTPYVFYTTRGLAVDAAGSIWVVNGTQGQLNQVIGLAAPTLPLFIHNGATIKP